MGLQANGRSPGEHHRPRRLAYAAQERRHLPARVPDTLHGGWRQSARDPGCASDACGGHRESPHARVALQEPLPLALAPTLGDRGCLLYGTTENIAAVEKAGMRAYMVLPKHDERGPLFGKNEFTYDAEKDLYICPRGETLRRQGHDYKERSIR